MRPRESPDLGNLHHAHAIAGVINRANERGECRFPEKMKLQRRLARPTECFGRVDGFSRIVVTPLVAR